MAKKMKSRAKYNLALFALSFVYIFVIGIFDEMINMHYVYYTVISAIILLAIFTVHSEGSYIFSIPSLIVISTWAAELLQLEFLAAITGYLATAFFLFVIVKLVYRVAQSKEVGTLEFLESINVYLLLGIAASVLFEAVYSHNHNSYNPPGEILQSQSDFVYYAFVTMTTLGYGDITPVSSIARSLSMFFTVAGQLYLTMIIAMLVGKYLSKNVPDDLED